MILLIFVSFGYQIDHTIYNNDWLHNLDQGFGIGSSNKQIQKFKEFADDNCILHSLDQSTLQECLNYQNIIIQNAYMSHPILGIFGSTLSNISLTLPSNNIALSIQNKIIFGGLFGVSLISIYLMISAMFLNQKFFKTLSVLFSIIIFSSELEIGYIRNIHDGINWTNSLLLSLLVLLGLFFFWKKYYDDVMITYVDYVFDFLIRNRHEDLGTVIFKVICMSLIYCGFAWMLFFQNAAVIDDAVMLIAIFLVFIITVKNKVDPHVVILLILCVVIATSNLPSRAIYPRHLCAIWIGISLISGLGAQRNVFLYLLPLCLFFHVGTAIVATGCLFITEILIFLFTRQATKLMLVSGFTCISGYSFTKIFWETGLHSGERILLTNLLSFSQNLFVFNYVIMLCALMVFISIRLLLKSRCANLHLSRALLLSAIILFVCQISASAKMTYGNTLDIQPGYFVLYRLPDYLTPSLSIAVLMLIILHTMRGSAMFSFSSPENRCFKSPKSLLILSVICFFPISAIDVNIKKLILAIEQYALYLNTETIEPRFAQLFSRLQFDDDVYILPRSAVPNSPDTYLSLLKLKIRISQGVATSVTISH